ncbi:MAG TPA: ArsR family transcriptional regulator [Acidimicrobiales bacterium]|nr:ArsR family transcriptional regulator [Acidimicrobiales bacterium]
MTGAPAGAGLQTMPEARRSVLVALKRAGAARAGDLAASLGLTVPAVRQQLVRLVEDGLVDHDSAAAGRGRPAHHYRLTEAGDALFPRRYGDLASELLDYLGGPASRQVEDLFEQRRRRRLAGARRRLAGQPLESQVAELARILDEDGYLADIEPMEDGWRIVEHNCAILSVARGYRAACTSELGFIREALPGARVERVSHQLDGAHVCAYEVRPGRAGTSATSSS